MTPDRNNFYFRHTKGDAVSERAVKMLNGSGKQRYYGKIEGGMQWSSEIDYFTAEKIPFISPSEAIRLMEGGEVWEPNNGDEVMGNPTSNQSISGEVAGLYVGKDSRGIHVLNAGYNYYGVCNIRPIPPAPPTAEQELIEIFERSGLRLIVSDRFYGDLYLDIINWFNRWALARAKGGEK